MCCVSLRTVTSLNKESRLLNFHFSKATMVVGDNGLKCSKCYDRKEGVSGRPSGDRPFSAFFGGETKGSLLKVVSTKLAH